MTKAEWVEALNDIEKKGLSLQNKSFVCGTQTNERTEKEMRQASKNFSDSISILRKLIISKGV